ncbi:DB module [Cooperia oncophora]
MAITPDYEGMVKLLVNQLIRMYFKQDACPIQATAEIQFCAAQGRDHRACCERNGVTTTLAGAKVLFNALYERAKRSTIT